MRAIENELHSWQSSGKFRASFGVSKADSMGAAEGTQRRTRYARLNAADGPSGDDPRFAMPAHLDSRLGKPGRKTLALGVGLCFVGFILLGCYLLWYFGIMPIPRDEERGTSLALLVLGCITLAPGLYVTTILAAVWRGVPGFSYDMIPSFED